MKQATDAARRKRDKANQVPFELRLKDGVLPLILKSFMLREDIDSAKM